jgi:hypothetical protein
MEGADSMRPMEIALATCMLFLIVGCSDDLSFEDVLGRYETTKYPGIAVGILILKGDCTYEQLFVYDTGDTLRNDGVWQFSVDKDYGSDVALRRAVVMSVMRISLKRTVTADTVEIRHHSPYSILGRIRIEADPDQGIVYHKVSGPDHSSESTGCP